MAMKEERKHVGGPQNAAPRPCDLGCFRGRNRGTMPRMRFWTIRENLDGGANDAMVRGGASWQAFS